jgi:ATP-dependent DNA helicase RecG
MNPALEKLVKYLRLEESRGYDDGAVLGGLAKMLEPWRGEARQAGVSEAVLQVVVSRLQDYGRLTPASRSETLAGLWKRLEEAYPELRPAAPVPATVAPAEPEIRPAVALPASAPPEPPQPAVDAVESFDATVDDQEDEADDQLDVGVTGQEADAVRSPAARPSTPASVDSPLTAVPGIGPKSASTLKKLGLETLGDLLWHLPRRYDDYTQLKTINRLWYGEEVTIIATVEELRTRSVRNGRLKLVEAIVGDGTGQLRVTWFNQVWIANRLKPGRPLVLSGRIEQYLGRLTMSNPEWEPLERQQLHTNRIVPVYPLTAGVTAKWLRRVIHSVVTQLVPRIEDPLPQEVLRSAAVIPLGIALNQVHFPDSWDQLKAAQSRLAFDEMLYLQLGVQRQKLQWVSQAGQPMPVADDWIERFKAALPFALTADQDRALTQVRADLASPRPMNRLLQGDVGSGKTVIAAAAAGIAAANAHQTAILAPTSILAEQHLLSLRQLLPQAAGVPAESIRLLIGATPAGEKEEIRAGLQDGSLRVVIGTHALLEDPVVFQRLGLAVIDEQHRFGVAQRAALRAKGQSPNLLVMTATPIPRSLALTVFGDLDLSLIEQMPPNRQQVQTQVMRPVERPRAHQFIRSQLEHGRQAFIIYPLVEESEKVEAKAAVDEFERLQQEVFPNFRLGLLHGRLRPDEKESVMARFRAGEYDVLVSTSVVEVGIDVPNATVILIEGANRFGLSQLHQFRGRVRRGEQQPYCLLIPDSEHEADNQRLKAMEKTDNGFELAELDLQQRGPGDFLGTRQSGFAELRAARLTDVRLIELARRQAEQLFEADPLLAAPEHAGLAAAVDRFWGGGKGDIS